LACGNEALTHSLVNSDVLVKKKFPVIFHGIAGKDEREETSPSFFNIDEATIVKKYCMNLIQNRRPRVRELGPVSIYDVPCLGELTTSVGPEDIGIITPYHAQAQKIRRLLLTTSGKYSDIKVGTVEEFQGQVGRSRLGNLALNSVRTAGTTSHHHVHRTQQPELREP
jgi:helicase MOV-10